MANLETIFEFLLNIDSHLTDLLKDYGVYAYLALFLLIYLETALIVTVFLPSDSVIFASCALASANDSLSFPVLLILFTAAAILGDSTNFSIGRRLRKITNKKQKFLFIKASNLEKTNTFLKRGGKATIIIARFVPVLRSLAPFVTGLSNKQYSWFFKHNLIGVCVWTSFFCGLGYFFGNLDFVRENFAIIVVGLMILSIFTAAISIVLSKLILKVKSKREV